MKRTVCRLCQHQFFLSQTLHCTHLAVVVLVQNPASSSLNVLVALASSSHAKRGVHVHIVTGEVQRNQALENDRPPRPRGAEEYQQTGGCAPVRHHVEHRTKSGGLIVVSRRISIQGIQQA